MNADEVIETLQLLAHEIEQCDAKLRVLYAKRLRAFKAGRKTGVTTEKMAAAAHVTEAAVIMSLRKDKQTALAAEHARSGHAQRTVSCPTCAAEARAQVLKR